MWCQALSLFLIEARKSDSKLFPAKTIDQMLQGILRYMRDRDTYTPNYMNHRATDTHLQKWMGVGVGARVNTPVRSPWIKEICFGNVVFLVLACLVL